MPRQRWTAASVLQPGPRLRGSARQSERRCAAPASTRRCHRPRPALTLIELLLVISLLVVMGSMTVPVFTGSFSHIRLRLAGDQIVSSWSQARRLAIETGTVHQFRFTPETGEYRIEPWLGDQEQSEQAAGRMDDSVASAPESDDALQQGTGDSPEQPEAPNEREEAISLPADIVFHAGELAVEQPLAHERSVDSLVAREEEQSTPILFFPDGATSDASVVLANDRRQYVRVALRSLTGMGRASQIMSDDELRRSDARHR
ncbi:MAG: hypothetical protein IT424_16470 [Pirellulales bacterium]|nr:hypothetical protein [Pirellulales bacterium]